MNDYQLDYEADQYEADLEEAQRRAELENYGDGELI